MDARNTSDPDTPAAIPTLDSSVAFDGDWRTYNWLMDVTTVGIVVTEADSGRIRLVNGEAARLFGYDRDQLLGQSVEVLMPERLHEKHVRHRHGYAATPRPRAMGTGVTLFGRRRDGSEFPLEIGLTPLATARGLIVVTTIIDISARWHSERALLRSQKMEAIGQLVNGIAHDFNNLLTIISGNLQLLEERLPPDDLNQAMLASASNAAARGSDLIRSLLKLSRKQATDPELTNIEAICRRLLPVLQRTFGETIEIRLSHGAAPWDVFADVAHVESAVLNLALNARDAMEGGGRLSIDVSNLHVDTPLETNTGVLPPGEYVALELSDTGCGMEPETLAHIFEPFFTTKDDDRGTGLGLAMVFAFVKRSNGQLRIVSTPGAGTTVTLLLPRHGGAATR